MKTNHIYVGDNVETLKTLPDESVDMCITSPPYYNLRDYKNDDQLGSEPTVTDFVDGLIEVFNEIYRVMKPTGSCWVNIGDTYSDKKLLQVPSRFEIEQTQSSTHIF
jgi:DNA modification methylase